MRPSFVFAFAVSVVSVVGLVGAGCSSGSGGDTGAAGSGAAGTTGVAGTTGTAGTGSAGTSGVAGATAGTTGAAGSTAGTTGVAGATAGTTGAAGSTAGTTGAAGAGGAAGTGAAGTGAAGTGSVGVVKSSGCDKDITETSTKWNQHNIMVTTVAPAYTSKFTDRIYWTRPPSGTYDKSHPYNLIIWGQGCGQGPTAESIPPYENPQAWASSVVVELLASQGQPNHCYSAGPDGDAADSPEIPYYDQVVSEVESEFCIDKSHVFQGGYSSGGWFSSLMSCVRTSVIRGTGWAAAGLQKNHDACVGPVAALITRATMDNGTPLDQTMDAVESLRMRNGCATTSKPWMPTWGAGEEKADTSSCLLYDGCTAGHPLVWCPTMGGHTNTEGDTHLTRDGLWKLWSTLP